MDPSPNGCFSCGRSLDGSPPEGRPLHRCAECLAGIEAYRAALGDIGTMPAPRFRGVIALDEGLPGWPTELTLVSLDVWDRFVVLHYVIEATPDLRSTVEPRKWTLTTDAGTVHHGGAGGGGTPGTDRYLAWDALLTPTLADDVALVHLRAQAPGGDVEGTIDLSVRPLTQRSAVVEPAGPPPSDADPGCPSCGPPLPPPPHLERAPGPELAWAMPEPPEPLPDPFEVSEKRPICAACQTSLDTVLAAKTPSRPCPDRVVALGAALGPLFGAALFVPSLSLWPHFFDLTVVGPSSGVWAAALFGKRGKRWTAHDDQGRTYVGAGVGAGSGTGLTNIDLTFVPALAPDATNLTLDFPACFDGMGPRATFAVTPGLP